MSAPGEPRDGRAPAPASGSGSGSTSPAAARAARIDELARRLADGPPTVHKTLAYRVIRGSVEFGFRLFCRLRVRGEEHLPPGGAVLVANHQSFLDIPLVASATRRHVCFVARDSLARSRFLYWLVRVCGALLVRRGQADRRVLRGMAAHLTAGDLVAVYPEGTRTSDGRVGPFKAGALLAARSAGVPVVPVALEGTFDAWPRQRRLPRPAPVRVTFCAPLDAGLPDALERARAAIVAVVEGPAGEPSAGPAAAAGPGPRA